MDRFKEIPDEQWQPSVQELRRNYGEYAKAFTHKLPAKVHQTSKNLIFPH